jgi:hypothetical protein
VQVELGCRSLIEPFSIRSFSSFLDESYPTAPFARQPIGIPTVDPERTLLEKIFLLHEEFQRPQEKIRVDRMSRHLFDIYKLATSPFAEKVLLNQELYTEIAHHRQSFTKLGGVNYKLHNPQTINPLPPAHLLEVWKKDYKTMQEQMIYAESPKFEMMLETIRSYVSKLNRLDWQIV